MRTLLITGERGGSTVEKAVRVRKTFDNGNMIVEWGAGKNKRIGSYNGHTLSTMAGTRFMTIMKHCFSETFVL
jgi:hypothetical protein